MDILWRECVERLRESCEMFLRDDAESICRECGKIVGKVGVECGDRGEIIW